MLSPLVNAEGQQKGSPEAECHRTTGADNANEIRSDILFLNVNRDRKPSSEANFVTGNPGAKFVVTNQNIASLRFN